MREALTGSRIRERRIMAGLKQAELARQIGISASYLNLIEHNRRRIGGKLLLDIAAALGVEAQALSEGAGAALIAGLREAALDARLSEAEVARADEFAGRFPGWAEALIAAQRRIAALERTVEALGDRLAHDPHLAAAMHELLSTATAIRSTAAILAETDTLEVEWQGRFHANLDEDSHRLAESARALLSYFDADPQASDSAGSPRDEVEAFFADYDFHFEALEDAVDPEGCIAELLSSGGLNSRAARQIAAPMLRQIAADAAALPMRVLDAALPLHGPDPAALAEALGQPVARLMRRLAARVDLDAGLVICDASGTLIFRKPIAGFSLPRLAACCPLWPLYAVLGHPGLVLSQRLRQIGRNESRFDSFATCEAQGAARYNCPPLTHALMLILPATGPDGDPAQEVGTTCRVCPRQGCPARRDPSILSEGR
ncbi:helix-turn-helix domain-containing protein [Sulfitobacter aestuarii]|uniref:Helix-turn-helix domain-containing protein n=1 Tax=Sulfitobacter aestuarii TaxID=2161676 RepID=A0ABW5U4E0_9RHOB